MTKAELIAAIADHIRTNKDQNLSVADIESGFAAALSHTYGSIGLKGGVTEQEIAESTPTKVNGFAINGASSGMTASATSDQITVITAGTYLTVWAVSFSGDANAQYYGKIAIDGSFAALGGFSRKLGVNGDVGSASCVSVDALTAGQVITAMIEGDADPTGFTPEDMTLFALRIGS